MTSIRTSVFTLMIAGALLGSVVAPRGVAVAANADNPSTFSDNPAEMNQDSSSLSERFFHVEWTAREGRPGTSRITGYIYNDYGQAAQDIELAITGLDSAGQPMSTAIERMPDTVPARGREYFDVQVPLSPSYRVNVDSFEFLEASGGN